MTNHKHLFLRTLVICTICLLLNYVQSKAQVSLSATAGTTTGSYTTVNAALAAINAGTHQGAITITVSANTTEPATPNQLLRSGASLQNYTSVTIKPSGNVAVDYSNIIGSPTSATTTNINRGIISNVTSTAALTSTTIGVVDNDNMTIQNNLITRCYYGFWHYGLHKSSTN